MSNCGWQMIRGKVGIEYVICREDCGIVLRGMPGSMLFVGSDVCPEAPRVSYKVSLVEIFKMWSCRRSRKALFRRL